MGRGCTVGARTGHFDSESNTQTASLHLWSPIHARTHTHAHHYASACTLSCQLSSSRGDDDDADAACGICKDENGSCCKRLFRKCERCLARPGLYGPADCCVVGGVKGCCSQCCTNPSAVAKKAPPVARGQRTSRSGQSSQPPPPPQTPAQPRPQPRPQPQTQPRRRETRTGAGLPAHGPRHGPSGRHTETADGEHTSNGARPGVPEATAYQSSSTLTRRADSLAHAFSDVGPCT